MGLRETVGRGRIGNAAVAAAAGLRGTRGLRSMGGRGGLRCGGLRQRGGGFRMGRHANAFSPRPTALENALPLPCVSVCVCETDPSNWAHGMGARG